ARVRASSSSSIVTSRGNLSRSSGFEARYLNVLYRELPQSSKLPTPQPDPCAELLLVLRAERVMQSDHHRRRCTVHQQRLKVLMVIVEGPVTMPGKSPLIGPDKRLRITIGSFLELVECGDG